MKKLWRKKPARVLWKKIDLDNDFKGKQSENGEIRGDENKTRELKARERVGVR